MTATPKTATARKAAQAEATGSSVKFTHDGTEYTVDPDALKDLDVLEAWEDGRVITGMKAILGADQWATFRKTHRHADDLNALVTQATAALGLQGN